MLSTLLTVSLAASAALAGPTLTGSQLARSPRRREDVTTDVNIGKKHIDYGCDASIRKTLWEAMDELCSDTFCDGGSEYSRDVDWTDGSGAPTPSAIKVTIKGSFKAKGSKSAYMDAVMATINDDTAEPEERHWNQNSFQGDISGICNMSRFPNYLHIVRWDGDNQQDEMTIEVEMEENDDFCLASDVLGAVGGAVSGVAGGFFGVVSAFCE